MDEGLVKLIKLAAREQCVIMGDFNFPEIKWHEIENLDETHFFVKTLNDTFLHQLVEMNTRDKNILDLILTSDESMIQSLSVVEPFSTSDHNQIIFSFYANKEMENDGMIRYNYFSADYNAIRQKLKEVDWSSLLTNVDVERDWMNFKAEINKCKEMIKIKKSGLQMDYKAGAKMS